MRTRRIVFRATTSVVGVALLILIYGGWGQLWLTSAYAAYRAGEPTRFEWLFDRIGTNKYDRSFKLKDLSRIEVPVFTADCDPAKLAGLAPYACIERLTSHGPQAGSPVAADVRWVNLPAGTILKFRIAYDGPRPNLGYLGPEGSVEPVYRDVAGTGNRRFTWSGRFGCTAWDNPARCNAGLGPGRYRLAVSAYPSQFPAAVGLAMMPLGPAMLSMAPGPPAFLTAASRPFTVGGEPDIGPIADALRAGASEALYQMSLRRHALSMAPSQALLPYNNGNNWQVTHRWGRYCADIPTSPPYRSSVSACVLDDDVRDAVGVRYIEPNRVAVFGSVTVLSGLMSQEEAAELARRPINAMFRAIGPGGIVESMQSCMWPASGPEVEACRAAHPYLLIDADESHFHPNIGNSWVFKMRYRLMGGTEAQRRLVQSQGIAMIRVGADRSVCLIQLRPGISNGVANDWPPPSMVCPHP